MAQETMLLSNIVEFLFLEIVVQLSLVGVGTVLTLNLIAVAAINKSCPATALEYKNT